MNERITVYGDPAELGSERTVHLVMLRFGGDAWAVAQANSMAHSTALAEAEKTIKKFAAVTPAKKKGHQPYAGRGGTETPRNGPCPCGSGRKSKNCERRGLCPK